MALFSIARQASKRARRGESGYILLTMLLVVAMMGILALALTVPLQFEMKRDQEQEMIHRGVQYSRAIRGYYKKFGRYPTKLEDLDNTNNLRYLRKHYKDPFNNKDFKLLHYGEPGVTLGLGSIGGGTIPGANPVGAPNGPGGGSAFGGSSASSFGGSSSSFGNSSFGGSGAGGSSFGNSNSGVNSSGVFAQSFGNSNNGSNSNNSGGTNGTNQTNGTDPSSNPQDSGSTKVSANGASDQSSSSQLISGGPIVGVASINKDKTIREYNKKKKYNEWQFVYDPSTDRGGLITTPYQPALAGFGQQNMQGANGLAPAGSSSPGQSPFGQSGQSSFGQSGQSSFGQSGFGQSGQSSFGQSGNNAAPSQPPANPPQQQ
jgi:type II secretory pathway pseudopilin PulG